MNNTRRKEIRTLIEKICELQSDLECILSDEDEYRENIPENLQESDRYYSSEEASDNLSSALENLEDVISYLEESTN